MAKWSKMIHFWRSGQNGIFGHFDLNLLVLRGFLGFLSKMVIFDQILFGIKSTKMADFDQGGDPSLGSNYLLLKVNLFLRRQAILGTHKREGRGGNREKFSAWDLSWDFRSK